MKIITILFIHLVQSLQIPYLYWLFNYQISFYGRSVISGIIFVLLLILFFFAREGDTVSIKTVKSN